MVVDSLAGGSSIPLEALRLGCETFARDLNPVVCLILKVMREDIPCYGSELAAEDRSLLDLSALTLELQDLLGVKVDVVSEDGIYWLLRREILKEARPL
ncbi:MAG: hypothetical protein PHW74_10910 [Desulfobacca sp.]|nr:hypothetical protein [Desulfobacca sp.]